MNFWDTSGVVPLLVREPTSSLILERLKGDPAMVVWWATRTECISALVRRQREHFLDSRGEDEAQAVLKRLTKAWTEIQPTPQVRETAERLLAVHPLRTADSLQLAAALIWTRKSPGGHTFICLDVVLRDAARKEGFTVVPKT